jgi:hypothetical protein
MLKGRERWFVPARPQSRYCSGAVPVDHST